MARKGVKLFDLESKREWDFRADPGAGYEVEQLVEQTFNRQRTSAATAARIAAGKAGPREKMEDEALKRRAARAWADPELSASAAAAEVGLGVATLYRHFGPKLDYVATTAAKRKDR